MYIEMEMLSATINKIRSQFCEDSIPYKLIEDHFSPDASSEILVVEIVVNFSSRDCS